MQTQDVSSITNSLFQACAKEFLKNGISVYGPSSGRVRAQLQRLAAVVVAEAQSGGVKSRAVRPSKTAAR